MYGTLKFFENQWVVKSLSETNDKLYPLWKGTQEWINKPSTTKFIKEGIEVVYDIVTTGENTTKKNNKLLKLILRKSKQFILKVYEF